jgi:hypothetical protein
MALKKLSSVKEKTSSAKPSTQVYQIKISLMGAQPPIWRRVLVPGGMKLGKLHNVFQGGDAMREARRLKLIALCATGSDNVDVATAKQCGVAVANIRDYCSTSLAQHVFALILGLTQQIGGYVALV